MAIDRNDAPEGYKARVFGGKRRYNCSHCSAYTASACPRTPSGLLWCAPSIRADATPVIFVRRKEKAA